MLCLCLFTCLASNAYFYFYSRIFHFVTRDYFRYRDESSDESDSVEDEGENGDFVAGGIYSPPVLPGEPTANGLKFAIENGIKEFNNEKLDAKKDFK